MVVVPAAKPLMVAKECAKPLRGAILATVGLLLVQIHVPDVKTVVVVPTHALKTPPTCSGILLTVNECNAIHPGPDVYAYEITAVPAITPVTMPVLDPIVATNTSLLLHSPSPDASVKVVVRSWHTEDGPLIVEMIGLTVNSRTAIHPPSV
jgi:hypothetical protein